MAKIVRCDRCKDEYDQDLNLTKEAEIQTDTQSTIYDLCNDCVKAVHIFITDGV